MPQETDPSLQKPSPERMNTWDVGHYDARTKAAWERMCDKAGLQDRRIRIYNDPYPEAVFDPALQPPISITTGLLELMDRPQVEAMLGHELGHYIKMNRDPLRKERAANRSKTTGYAKLGAAAAAMYAGHKYIQHQEAKDQPETVGKMNRRRFIGYMVAPFVAGAGTHVVGEHVVGDGLPSLYDQDEEVDADLIAIRELGVPVSDMIASHEKLDTYFLQHQLISERGTDQRLYILKELEREMSQGRGR